MRDTIIKTNVSTGFLDNKTKVRIVSKSLRPNRIIQIKYVFIFYHMIHQEHILMHRDFTKV